MKNISMKVLFGLLLVFGVLIASCDNGVLPKHDPDDNHRQGEYNESWIAGDNPLNESPATMAYYDIFTYTSGSGWSLGGDGVADGTTQMKVSDIAGLGTKYVVDPADGLVYAVTLANIPLTGGPFATKASVKATKGAEDTSGTKPIWTVPSPVIVVVP